MFENNRATAHSVAELLLEAAERTGFTSEEIEAMVDSELNTLHLLDYITAVVTDRMN